MKIFVVEILLDDVQQIGFSTSKQVAEQKVKEYYAKHNILPWVTEYTTNKDNWCNFD